MSKLFSSRRINLKLYAIEDFSSTILVFNIQIFSVVSLLYRLSKPFVVYIASETIVDIVLYIEIVYRADSEVHIHVALILLSVFLFFIVSLYYCFLCSFVLVPLRISSLDYFNFLLFFVVLFLYSLMCVDPHFCR